MALGATIASMQESPRPLPIWCLSQQAKFAVTQGSRLPTHGRKGDIREEPLHRRLQTWPNVKIPTRWAQNHIKTNGLKTNTNLCLADFPNSKIPKQIMVLNITQFLLALSADAALFHKFAQRENYMRTRPETVEGKNLPPPHKMM